MAELREKIEKLKQERNAVILAHYYVEDDVQEIADFVGDSFYLAKVAKETDCDTIVFCGVEFMGESAKILNPTKTVLMPDMSADCPMAHMASVEKVEEMKKKYEDLAVVCYINSSAELKTHSDVCVTSANAQKIVNALPNKNIFFIPDGNLGRYIGLTSDKNIIYNDGYCHVHHKLIPDVVEKVKKQYPNVKVLMHPECSPKTLELADFIGSTSAIINYATKSDDKEFIICTEHGVGYELRKRNPNKKFYFPEPLPTCVNMKKVTIEKVAECLEGNDNAVEIDDETRKKALVPLNRMLELAK